MERLPAANRRGARGAAAERLLSAERDFDVRKDLKNAHRNALKYLAAENDVALDALTIEHHEEAQQIVDYLRSAAEEIVWDHRSAIGRLANVLAEGRALSGDEIDQIIGTGI